MRLTGVSRSGGTLFVLPPHFLKLNGHAKLANRTHRTEFWELDDEPLELSPLQEGRRAWVDADYDLRTYYAVGYRTTAEFLPRSVLLNM